MENPATWNEFIKTLNNQLDWGNCSPLTVDMVISIIVNSNLFIGEGKRNPQNHMIREVIDTSIYDYKYEMNNQICGSSFGNKLYYKLKALQVVE